MPGKKHFQKKKSAAIKNQKRHIRSLLIGLAVVATVIAALIILSVIDKPVRSVNNAKVTALKNKILTDYQLTSDIADGMSASGREGFFVVFLSVCNTEERALVFHAAGSSIQEAWEKAEQLAATALQNRKGYQIVWVKADIVDSVQSIQTVELNQRMVDNRYSFFYRKGLAFDRDFNTAFLEAELNGNKMLTYYSESDLFYQNVDHESNRLNLTNINFYLQHYYHSSPVNVVPKQLTEFTARSFFCEDEDTLHELYSSGLDTGRRMLGEITDELVTDTITKASRYLADLIQPDGEFIYGYYPIFGNKINSYNIVRHASSMWSLINLYRMTGDESVVPKLNNALRYLTDGYIEYRDSETAYIVERKNNEIKLGANSVAVIMLTEYMDVFQTDQYAELVRHLANGIIRMQNSEEGSFSHVLHYPSYETAEEFRTVYYDGEAVFALAKTYTLLGDSRYLDAAAAGVEYFIKQNYIKYRDHWVAYSMNEITKHIPDPRYFEFAMNNITENLDRIYQQPTSFHTYLELLTIGWQTYERILEKGIRVDGMGDFNTEQFAQTIYWRARHMLNGFFYPEFAMYMKYPNTIVNAFMVRHASYRTRIDDVQHFIGGYYYYTMYYEKIRSYLTEKFLADIENAAVSTAGNTPIFIKFTFTEADDIGDRD